MRTLNGLLLAILLAAWPPSRSEAKSYSSGGGRSYSSHSSSHTSRSGSSSGGSGSSSRSSSAPSSRAGSSYGSSAGKGSSSGSTATRSPSSSSGNKSTSPSATRSTGSDQAGSKTYHSSSGKSYSSGSTSSDDSRRSYTSGKSYTSGSASDRVRPKATEPSSASSKFSFDTAAARARKEEASQKEFTRFKDSQIPKPPPLPNNSTPSAQPAEPPPSYRVQPPPIRREVYVPDREVVVTRPARRHIVFYPYESRPVIVYRDPYSSLFWWWLLDRSLDDRAQWTYHHRYDMDPARYQALLANNQELENRVQQLEAEQVSRDPKYVPPGVDRDLMYSDRSLEHAYSNRPTTSGRIAFWIFAIPICVALGCFFVWFIFFKRWQPSNSTA